MEIEFMSDLTKLSAEVAMLREALSEIITQDDAHQLDSRHINKGRDALTATEATAAAWERRVRDEEREKMAGVCDEIAERYEAAESNNWAELKTDAATGAEDCAHAIRSMKGKQW